MLNRNVRIAEKTVYVLYNKTVNDYRSVEVWVNELIDWKLGEHKYEVRYALILENEVWTDAVFTKDQFLDMKNHFNNFENRDDLNFEIV